MKAEGTRGRRSEAGKGAAGRLAGVACLVVSLVVGTARAADRGKITVSAAASLREVMKEVAVVYQRERGVEVELNLGASGALAAQIDAGAPVDVFISAGEREVDDLAKKGRVDPTSRRIVARNSVVLILKHGANPDAVKGFKDLANPGVKRVAIGEPRSVPAGEYAVQVLTSMRVWDAVKPKAVYAANVRQVLDYVIRGEVDAGVVYTTDADEARGKVTVIETAPEATHQPVVYPAVVVNGGNRTASRAFLDYLMSDPGRAIFQKRAFVVEAGGGRG